MPRPRLLARLADLPGLTLVSGPVGSGKTTLVTQWAAAQRAAGRTVLWLDGDVDGPAEVVRVLADVVGFAVPSGLTPTGVLAGLTSRLRTLQDQLTVVIDGFDPLALELGAPLIALLDRCRRLHLVLCVRGWHELAAQAAGRTTHQLITMADLALTAEELKAYAARRGISVDETTVRTVLQQTWGLPVLARVGLHDRHHAADGSRGWWSWDVVCDFLRDRLQRELHPHEIAGVSALDRLTVADLDTVLAALRPDDAEILPALQKVSGVERHPESGRLNVRTPPIVSEVLRSLRDPSFDAELAPLHDCVIAELERVGQVLEAVSLARLTARHQTLLDLLKLHWWDIAVEDISVLADALASVPDDLFPPRELLMRYLTVLIPDREAGAVPTATDPIPMDAIEGELRQYASGPDAGVYLDIVMLSMMVARFRGDRISARQQMERGLATANALSRTASPELPVGTRRFFVQVGLVHLLDLDLPGAERAFRRAYGPDEHAAPDVLRREAANKLAFLHAVKGDHPATRAWLDRAAAIEPPSGWVAPMIEAPRRLAEAILALDRLDREEVESQLAELAKTVLTDELWFMELTVRAAASLLWGGVHAALHEIQLNRVDRAHLTGEGTLAQAQLVAWEVELHIALGQGTAARSRLSADAGSARTKVARARLLILSGGSREALALLASVTQTSHDYSRLRVEAHLLSAQAMVNLGDAETARSHLARAALHPAFVSTFASAPRSLLTDHSSRVPDLMPIIDALDAQQGLTPLFPEVLEVVSLTEREQRLVELLPTPQSRDAIAAELWVSTNTVKTHLGAVYRKLGVASRDEAVARAYELGLLR